MDSLKCDHCGGKLRFEEGDFGEKIRRCWNCARSPDEKKVTVEEVMLIMKGTSERGKRSE